MTIPGPRSLLFRVACSWNEAADLIIKGVDGAIGAKTVT